MFHNLLCKTTILILFIYILFSFSPVYSQYDYLKFRQYSVTEGLSQNTVRFVLQDKYGFMWFGTFHGLNRFDGYNFKAYKTDLHNPKSLSSNRCFIAGIDSSGTLWVETYDFVYHRYNVETDDFTRYKSKQDVPKYLRNRMNEIRKEQKWQYKKHQFNYNSSRRKTFTYVDLRTNNSTKCYRDDKNPYGLKDAYILDIFIDSCKTFWAGTFSGGVFNVDLNRKHFVHYKKTPYTDNTLIDNNIREILEDKNGIIWIGTRSKGITCFDRENNKYTLIQRDPDNPNSLRGNDIRDIFEDKNGNIFIGTKSGLDKYDPETQQFTRVFSESRNRKWVFDIMEDHDGFIWFVTFGGLYKIDHIHDTIINYNAENEIIADNSLRFLHEDSKHFIWTGSETGGVTRLERAGTIREFVDTFKSVFYAADTANLKGINSNRAYCICEDETGTIWIGTGDGLNRYNRKDDTFSHFTTKNGLPDEMIIGLLYDQNGNIWISHKRGISKMDIKTFEVHNYGVLDGLQDIEFNEDAFYRSPRTGEMFFGGPKGFNAFYPDSITDNPIEPSVVITDLHILDMPVEIGKKINGRVILEKNIILTKEITITHKEKMISIEFAAIHYANPNRNQYEYKLENFDDKWIKTDAKRRIAVYSNLEPGIYFFKVRASNCDGVWCKEPTVLKINVLPPWWATWWFRILIFIALVAGLVSFYFIRVNTLKKQQKLLERKVKERTEELYNANAELEERHEEILQQKEEITTQAEELSEANEMLSERNDLIENQNKEIEKTYKDLQLLSDFGQELTSTLNIEEVNLMIYEYLSSMMDTSAFGIGIFNKERNAIDFFGFIENGEKQPYFNKSLDSKNSLSVWCFQNQKTVFVNDLEKEYKDYFPELPEIAVSTTTKSIIHLPLTVKEKKIGIIVVNSFRKNAYNKNDITKLKSLASYIAIAFDNANAYSEIETYNKSINSSINYAKTIQQAILPEKENIDKVFENFIIFRPKDIVSGDFYWYTKTKSTSQDVLHYLAVIDCTGHGVPGAFMSMIGSQLFNEVLNEKKIYNPVNILSKVDELLRTALRKDQTDNHDGMDVCMVVINDADLQKDDDEFPIIYIGAGRPLYRFNHTTGEVEVTKGSVKSIGNKYTRQFSFVQHNIRIRKGDILYLTSDGFIDQQNPNRKRFSSTKLLKLIAENNHLPMIEQGKIIEQALDEHQQNEEQRDDISVWGIKI